MKIVLVPVWYGAFQYGGKEFSFCVDGVTGSIHGKKPISLKRIGIAAAVGFVPEKSDHSSR